MRKGKVKPPTKPNWFRGQGVYSLESVDGVGAPEGYEVFMGLPQIVIRVPVSWPADRTEAVVTALVDHFKRPILAVPEGCEFLSVKKAKVNSRYTEPKAPKNPLQIYDEEVGPPDGNQTAEDAEEETPGSGVRQDASTLGD